MKINPLVKIVFGNIALVSLLTAVFASSSFSQGPPFHGTIYVENNIINKNDCSAFDAVSYKGKITKYVYDRRLASWANIPSHVFNVKWRDSLSTLAVINAEFSCDEAKALAQKYGFQIGQLPRALRTGVTEIWIHKGDYDWGGGNRSILIHTGRALYFDSLGISEEALVHEGTHTSLDATHAGAAGWVSAQKSDVNFISTYARDYPTREDLAETLLLWLGARYRFARISTANYQKIVSTIPARMKYLDDQRFNLNPFNCKTTSITADHQRAFTFQTRIKQNRLSVIGAHEAKYHLKLYSTRGELVAQNQAAGNTIDLSNLPRGFYTLQIQTSTSSIKQPIVIY